MDDSLNMESNQLLDKLYSDIDLLPLKVNDVVDLVKQNFEKKSKIHYDSAQFEIKTLNEKISKEQIELQDVDEINRLITNVDNLRKELEFKTSDFHR